MVKWRHQIQRGLRRMIKSKKLLIALTSIFLIVEALLGVLLQTAQDSIPINLRYTAVILACLFCIIFAERSKSYMVTQIALICTVCADYFLVYRTDMQQLPAMIFFSVVQTAYFLRLYFDDNNKARKIVHLITRVTLSMIIIAITFAVLGKNVDAVAVVSMFYYANLVMNAVFAFISFKKHYILAIGLLLFILCDTVIGFSLIKTYISVPSDSFIYKIIYPGFDLAWAFYLPSQVLLSVSLLSERIRQKR